MNEKNWNFKRPWYFLPYRVKKTTVYSLSKPSSVYRVKKTTVYNLSKPSCVRETP